MYQACGSAHLPLLGAGRLLPHFHQGDFVGVARVRSQEGGLPGINPNVCSPKRSSYQSRARSALRT